MAPRRWRPELVAGLITALGRNGNSQALLNTAARANSDTGSVTAGSNEFAADAGPL
jgi:hypothetical protein